MMESILKGFEIWTSAQGVKSKGKVKSIDNISQEGIARLRSLILELAIQGKLTLQNFDTENSIPDINELIEAKKTLEEEGKIKKEKPLTAILEKEKLLEIPQNWSWIKLGTIGITNIGLTYSPNDISNDGLIVLRSGNIQNGEIDLTDLVRVNKKVDDRVLVAKRDLLICARNGSRQLVGKCAIIKSVEEPMAFGAFMAIYRCQFNEYIKLFIESPSYRKNLDGVSTTTINQITQDNLRNTVVPIPPFEEQKRIVAKVNELMGLCDKLEQQQTANFTTHHFLVKSILATLTNAVDADELQIAWEKLSEHFDTLFCTEDSIDQLKQAIFQLAIMGRLVKRDESDEPASVFINRIKIEKEMLIEEGKLKRQNELKEVKKEEEPFAIPPNWKWTKLGIISADIHYGFNASANTQIKNIRLLRITDIQNDNVAWETVPGCSITEDQIGNYELENGDIVIARTGGTIGKSYLVKNLPLKAVFASYLIRVRKLPSTFPDYIKTFLGSRLYWDQLFKSSMGTGQPNVNGTALKSLLIPVPPYLEQKRIVSRLKGLLTVCELLTQKINDNLQTKALLADSVIRNI